jgi:hypothetical protein
MPNLSNKNFNNNVKVTNYLTIFNNDVVGRDSIDNLLFRRLGFLTAGNVEQVWMLQNQIVLDVSQLGGGFDCRFVDHAREPQIMLSNGSQIDEAKASIFNFFV